LEQTDVSEIRTASTISLMMEAVHNSETSVYFKETTWRYIPEASIFMITAAFAETL
jgi:hypothetical protein